MGIIFSQITLLHVQIKRDENNINRMRDEKDEI